MDVAKAEFKSCAITGIFGLLISFSIIAGAHYLSSEMKKEENPTTAKEQI